MMKKYAKNLGKTMLPPALLQVKNFGKSRQAPFEKFYIFQHSCLHWLAVLPFPRTKFT